MQAQSSLLNKTGGWGRQFVLSDTPPPREYLPQCILVWRKRKWSPSSRRVLAKFREVPLSASHAWGRDHDVNYPQTCAGVEWLYRIKGSSVNAPKSLSACWHNFSPRRWGWITMQTVSCCPTTTSLQLLQPRPAGETLAPTTDPIWHIPPYTQTKKL